MNAELIVCWDGRHQNTDADLLCALKIPQKRSAPPISSDGPGRKRTTQELIARVLEGGGLTLTEILQLTGLSEYAGRSAIERLRDEGAVQAIARRRQPTGPPVCVYTLTPEDR